MPCRQLSKEAASFDRGRNEKHLLAQGMPDAKKRPLGSVAFFPVVLGGALGALAFVKMRQTCGSQAEDKHEASEERFRRLFEDPAGAVLLLLHTPELASRLGLTGTIITGHVGRFRMPAKMFPLKRWRAERWPWEPKIM